MLLILLSEWVVDIVYMSAWVVDIVYMSAWVVDIVRHIPRDCLQTKNLTALTAPS